MIPWVSKLLFFEVGDNTKNTEVFKQILEDTDIFKEEKELFLMCCVDVPN